MSLGIVDKYKANIEDLSAIFEVSLTLKDLYESSLKRILENPQLNYSQKHVLQNALSSLIRVEESSIQDAESGAWARLYPQALIIVVSIAEQLLKEIFEMLVDIYLEKISLLDGKDIKFKDVKDKGFTLNRSDWVEIAVKTIYGDSNPNEKINFQNILSIKEIFKSYFNISINISEELQKSLHFYYQCRHVIIHNTGVVDERFIKNLKKAGVSHPYTLQEKILITQDEFEDCKRSFLQFFETLESTIEKQGN